MIGGRKQELVERAGKLFARGGKAAAVGDAQNVVDDLHRKVGQLQVERDFLVGEPAISRVLGEAGDDHAESGAIRKPAMSPAGGRAEQILLPIGRRRAGFQRYPHAALHREKAAMGRPSGRHGTHGALGRRPPGRLINPGIPAQLLTFPK
ncbi:MAG: hypothetical protein M0002_20545 [Rhodospirillales bacterium]|nr:hypothetical protein [Rhodospirillales bacterium]